MSEIYILAIKQHCFIMVGECFMSALSRMCEYVVIGRVPVVSASGEPLMPYGRE